MTFSIFKKCYASNVVHTRLILLTECFDVQMQMICLRAANNTQRKLNLVQELEN